MSHTIRALELAKKALEHIVPENCWATGPSTGDPFEDLIVCPGCRALHAISEAQSVQDGRQNGEPSSLGGIGTAAREPSSAQPFPAGTTRISRLLYDPACYELAKHFGEGYSEEELKALASDFQDAAESFHSWRDSHSSDETRLASEGK